MSVNERTSLTGRFRSTRIVSQLLMTGVLAYSAVAYFVVATSFPLLSPEPTGNLMAILYATGGLLGIGVVIGRRIVFRPSRLTRLVDQGGVSRLIRELVLQTIVLALLSESIAVLGLLVSLLTQTFDPMLHLGAVALILLFYTMPRRSSWEKTVESFSPRVYEGL